MALINSLKVDLCITLIWLSIFSGYVAQSTQTSPSQKAETTSSTGLVVNFPLGQFFPNSEEGGKDDVVGSVIGVDATATTYAVGCNPNIATLPTNAPEKEACDPDTPSLTITQGPRTVLFSMTFIDSDYTQLITENCTLAATAAIPASTGTLPSVVTCLLQGTQMASYDINSQGETVLNPMTGIEIVSRTYGVESDGRTPTVPWAPARITAGLEKFAAAAQSSTSPNTTPATTSTTTSATTPATTPATTSFSAQTTGTSGTGPSPSSSVATGASEGANLKASSFLWASFAFFLVSGCSL